jgi:hypothetical protein
MKIMLPTYKRVNKLKLFIIACAIVCVLLGFLLVISLFENNGSPWTKISIDAISSILAGLISILVFSIYKTWRDESEQESHIQNTIWSLMRARNDNFINELYKEDAVDDVVHNCLNNYCADLADSYFNYIKHNVNIFRTKMDYNVEVCIDEKSGSNYSIIQEISYRKNFKVSENSGQYVFKCFFALRPGALEKRLNESDWFFREEITDKETIKSIKASSGDKDVICKILELQLFLGDDNSPVAKDDIEMKIDEDGVSFIVDIPKENYTFTTNTNANAQDADAPGYVSYKAKVCCKTPNLSRNFYCVFTEPTIAPRFSIKFPLSIPIKDVNLVSCLTLPNVTQKHIDEKRFIVNNQQFNKIEFKIENEKTTIFPRSGIYFNW